ncbi:MAG: hypothetical protein PWP41_875 [Moorella sp. (in: firmicutes)]|uniref:Uncharacterized protein n=1 Tax=Neomoorella thermoacetica TaxID=1525 RepID=A0A1J5NYQ2_NEOTH|nr:hypothetical protein [Moorella sp. (in: firmicutes)]OIQ58483.1 hypothetical protein MOTE_20050 [Moorella thermoacetica]
MIKSIFITNICKWGGGGYILLFLPEKYKHPLPQQTKPLARILSRLDYPWWIFLVFIRGRTPFYPRFPRAFKHHPALAPGRWA